MKKILGYYPALLPRIRRHVPPPKLRPRVIKREAVKHREESGVIRGAVLATETPVERFDVRREKAFREVLTMGGLLFRGDRKQIPLLDGSAGETVRAIVGSCRNLRVSTDELISDLYFASDDDARRAASKVFGGHLGDLRLNVQPLEVVRLSEGETYRTRAGIVEGPADVVVAWMPLSVELAATGPDPRAVAIR